MRTLAILVVLLLAPLAAVPPAAASAALAVEAGSSLFVTTPAAIQTDGRAAGGVAPYTYSWSHAGSATRFGHPAAAVTWFETSGLSGDVVLTLTVTDSVGSSASDTVRHRISAELVLLDVTRTIAGGVFVLSYSHPFTVPAGVGSIRATLDWGLGLNDLDFELFAPGGGSATGTTAQTGAKPEVATVNSPAPGAWRADVYPYLTGPETYHLRIVAPGEASPLPATSGRGPWAFGALDAQLLQAIGDRGTPPYTFAWDLDGDRVAETPGKDVTASLPPGEHDLLVRLHDAAGYEVEAPVHVTVGTAQRVLRLQCAADPRSIVPMEFTSTKNTCWIHGGHHTYFTGASPWTLRRLHGFVFSVEQQFAWPQEFAGGDLTRAPIVFETSMDGASFAPAGHAVYTLLATGPPISAPQRQGIWFGFDVSGGGDLRFLRARNPLSVTQGISGFLDNSLLFAHVDAATAPASPPVGPATRSLSCQRDILEDFFPDHPCTFGGIDRYDAPSFWHTYPLGEGATLKRIAGTFTLAPWRTDDWNQGRPATQAANTTARVQISGDGVAWADAGVVAAVFGVPAAFDLALPDASARFVRVFPEYHARYDQTRDFAPNHHPRGYFLHSEVAVTGTLPT